MIKDESDPAPPKRRVVIVDDERVIADTVAMILNQSGYESFAAYSGEEAVDLARSLEPDILMCDIVMCDLNGIEAAILIHDILPSIRIFLHAGRAEAADMLENARDRGYELEVMAVPFHPQHLLRELAMPFDPQNIFRPERIRNPARKLSSRIYSQGLSSLPSRVETRRNWNILRWLFKGTD